MNEAAAGAICLYYSRTPGVDCPSEENAANGQCINLDHPYVIVDRTFKHVVMKAVRELQAASLESKYDHDSLRESLKQAKETVSTLDTRVDQMLTTLHMAEDK